MHIESETTLKVSSRIFNSLEESWRILLMFYQFQGDINASRLLTCLTYVVGLYGEQLVLLQYFPHMVDVVAKCSSFGSIPLLLEGGLIGCCSLLLAVISYLQVIVPFALKLTFICQLYVKLDLFEYVPFQSDIEIHYWDWQLSFWWNCFVFIAAL